MVIDEMSRSQVLNFCRPVYFRTAKSDSSYSYVTFFLRTVLVPESIRENKFLSKNM